MKKLAPKTRNGSVRGMPISMRCIASTLSPGAASMASVGVRVNIPDWKRRYSIPCTSAPVESSIIVTEKINSRIRVHRDEICRVLRRRLQQSANRRTTAPYVIAELIIPNICISTCRTPRSVKRNSGGHASGKSISFYGARSADDSQRRVGVNASVIIKSSAHSFICQLCLPCYASVETLAI